jgi:hypothetical protein
MLMCYLLIFLAAAVGDQLVQPPLLYHTWEDIKCQTKFSNVWVCQTIHDKCCMISCIPELL